MPEFFDFRPPVLIVEEDRFARKEDRQQLEDSIDNYLEIKQKTRRKSFFWGNPLPIKKTRNLIWPLIKFSKML
jgi:hypothetical protein